MQCKCIALPMPDTRLACVRVLEAPSKPRLYGVFVPHAAAWAVALMGKPMSVNRSCGTRGAASEMSHSGRGVIMKMPMERKRVGILPFLLRVICFLITSWFKSRASRCNGCDGWRQWFLRNASNLSRSRSVNEATHVPNALGASNGSSP